MSGAIAFILCFKGLKNRCIRLVVGLLTGILHPEGFLQKEINSDAWIIISLVPELQTDGGVWGYLKFPLCGKEIKKGAKPPQFFLKYSGYFEDSN